MEDRQLIQQPDNPTQVHNKALQGLICICYHQSVQQQWRPQTITPHNTHRPISHTSIKVYLVLSYLIWWRATSLNKISPLHQPFATPIYLLMSQYPSKGSMWQNHQSYQAFTGIEFSFIQLYHIMVWAELISQSLFIGTSMTCSLDHSLVCLPSILLRLLIFAFIVQINKNMFFCWASMKADLKLAQKWFFLLHVFCLTLPFSTLQRQLTANSRQPTCMSFSLSVWHKITSSQNYVLVNQKKASQPCSHH